MKKLALILSLVPSVALAHPGHDDVGVGGEPATHALITNPIIGLALVVVLTLAIARVCRMVRK